MADFQNIIEMVENNKSLRSLTKKTYISTIHVFENNFSTINNLADKNNRQALIEHFNNYLDNTRVNHALVLKMIGAKINDSELIDFAIKILDISKAAIRKKIEDRKSDNTLQHDDNKFLSFDKINKIISGVLTIMAKKDLYYRSIRQGLLSAVSLSLWLDGKGRPQEFSRIPIFLNEEDARGEKNYYIINISNDTGIGHMSEYKTSKIKGIKKITLSKNSVKLLKYYIKYERSNILPTIDINRHSIRRILDNDEFIFAWLRRLYAESIITPDVRRKLMEIEQDLNKAGHSLATVIDHYLFKEF